LLCKRATPTCFCSKWRRERFYPRSRPNKKPP
jgi:hypothetical protein